MAITWVTWLLGIVPLLGWLLWWWNDLRYALPAKLRCSASGGGTRLPPGHMGVPIFGELLSFLWYFKIRRHPDDFINMKRHKYGDGVGMYRTYLFGSPSIIVCAPSVSKFVYQSGASFIREWPSVEILGHTALVNVEGAAHTRLRNFMSRAINQPAALHKLAHMVQPRVIAALQSWTKRGIISAYSEVKKVTFENIGMYFASIEPGQFLDALDELFKGMACGVRANPINLPGTAYHHGLQCRKKLLAIFREKLEKKRINGDGAVNDLLDGLMQLKDDEGNQLSDIEVLDNIVSLVLGGYESTSLSITWALYYLAKYPNVLQKLREENLALSKSKNGDLITSDDIGKLKYTSKVVEETIRLANVGAFTFRTATEDVEYQGYRIPKGWKVILWLRYSHTNPENFEDPLCFNPDRWDVPAKPGTYQVFGGGPKLCVGNMLARLQVAVFLHHLTTGYKWKLINPEAEITYLPNPRPADGVELELSEL